MQVVGKPRERDPCAESSELPLGSRTGGPGVGEGEGAGDSDGGMQECSSALVIYLMVDPDEGGWGQWRGRKCGRVEEVVERRGGEDDCAEREEPAEGDPGLVNQ